SAAATPALTAPAKRTFLVSATTVSVTPRFSQAGRCVSSHATVSSPDASSTMTSWSPDSSTLATVGKCFSSNARPRYVGMTTLQGVVGVCLGISSFVIRVLQHTVDRGAELVQRELFGFGAASGSHGGLFGTRKH